MAFDKREKGENAGAGGRTWCGGYIRMRLEDVYEVGRITRSPLGGGTAEVPYPGGFGKELGGKGEKVRVILFSIKGDFGGKRNLHKKRLKEMRDDKVGSREGKRGGLGGSPILTLAHRV